MTKALLKSFVICCLCIFCISCSNNDNQINLNLIPVKSGAKWGYINKKGEYVINPQFQDANFFRDGLAYVVSTEGKVGYIDDEGKYVIPAKYKDGTPFKENLAFVVSDGGYPTCIDKSGEIKFTLKQAQYAYWFTDGMAMFQTKDSKFGFIDKNGKVVVNAQFEYARPFSEGFSAVCQNKKWGFIDKTGKIIINPQFDAVMDFYNGKAAFCNNKQCGFIDTKGSYVINPQFDYVMSFSEGMASILSASTFGYINEAGKIEINPQFEEAHSFHSDLAVIMQDKKYGYINNKGKIEINPQFDNATQFFKDIAFVKSTDKWGIIDKEGKYLVNPQFDDMKEITHEEVLKISYNFDNNIPFVKTDYYNTDDFISNFMKRVTDTTFDGINKTSTLQDIVGNPLYGENLNANDEYRADCDQTQKITNDVFIKATSFYFSQPIYTLVSDGWWSTKKQYNLSEKVVAIEYKIDMSGEATDKGSAIANALQNEIGKRYKVALKNNNESYIAYQKDGQMSFAIVYTDYFVSLYISFSEEKLQTLLTKTKDENVD